MLAGAIKTPAGEAAEEGTTTTVTTTRLHHIRRAHHERRKLPRHRAAAGLRLHRNGSLAFGVARPLGPQPEPQPDTQREVDPRVRHDNLLEDRVGLAAAVVVASRHLVGATWRDPAAVHMNRQVLEARGGVEAMGEWLKGLT
jgi:hypothetical protein